MADLPSELMTIDEAAAYLRQPVKSLRYQRDNGTGPPSARIGRRVWYLRSDLEQYVAQAFADQNGGVAVLAGGAA